jgi:hypothetical protein
MQDHDRNDEWKARERQRLFITREYPKVPWHGRIGTPGRRIIDNHFVHVSTHDPRMIAYTETADKGRRDIQTRVKPGKYLKRYFGDMLSDDQIREWAEKVQRRERDAIAQVRWRPRRDRARVRERPGFVHVARGRQL